MGGYEQVKLLKQVVEDFEKDASEQRYLSQSDLAPLIEAEHNRLFEQMQKTYAETTNKLKAVS